MHRVFVSYKAEDRARLKPLVSALEASGFDVWWDANIGAGSDWRGEIQRRLDAADCVLVAWTERSVGAEGRFVRDEASRAQKRGTYLPIRLDDVDPPLGFGEVQAFSLIGWNGKRRDRRFVALVNALHDHIGRVPAAASPGTRVTAPRLTRRTVVAGALGGSALAAIGGWALIGRRPAAVSNRIAVMSFANLSGDPAQAYFSEGIAEELRAALSRIGMQVIGRASSDAVKNLDIKDAARKLGVSNILTGSVRRTTEIIRINAQLVGGDDEVERWAQSYDRPPGDAITIQTDIAQRVASALSVALGAVQRAALSLGATADSAAHDLYLQSQQLLRSADNAGAFGKLIALLDGALARDPNYGDAYLGKSYALVALAIQYATSAAALAEGLTAAEQAALRAAEIMPASGRPAAMLSEISASRLDFTACLRLIQKALAADANDAFVLARVVKNLTWLGDNTQALALADRAIALDPLNAVNYTGRGRCLLSSGRYEEAVAAGRQAVALQPTSVGARILMSAGLIQLNRTGEVPGALATVPADNTFRLASEGVLAARLGDRSGAESIIAKLRSNIGDNASYQYAEIYAQLPDADRAFAALDRAVEVKDPGLLILKRDPALASIRRDPRFARLLRRLNFP